MPNEERKQFREWFAMFLNNDNVSDEALQMALKQRAEKMSPPYGAARGNDFGELSSFVAKAFAYDNKHYFVYRAIENPNKMAFLSHKQFYKLWGKLKGHTGDLVRNDIIKNYLQETGKMSSPYKLFKKALKENPRMKFLSCFFKVDNEGNCENEDKLIKLCDNLLSKSAGLTVEEVTVQECYDLRLPDRYNGSGHRFATHSCMQGRPIGRFYEALPLHGMMIKRDGHGIGRFLLWDLPDGRQYVDRLYCREREANACLELIDRKYPDALKYPLEGEDVFNIQFKNLDIFETNVLLPYIDSFPYLHAKDGTLCLSNTSQNHDGYVYQQSIHFASGGSGYVIKRCPHCGQVWFGYRSTLNEEQRNHKFLCSAYKPRNKQLQEYLKIYKQLKDEIGGLNNGTEGFVYEV